jgi:hypothetical protein
MELGWNQSVHTQIGVDLCRSIALSEFSESDKREPDRVDAGAESCRKFRSSRKQGGGKAPSTKGPEARVSSTTLA